MTDLRVNKVYVEVLLVNTAVELRASKVQVEVLRSISRTVSASLVENSAAIDSFGMLAAGGGGGGGAGLYGIGDSGENGHPDGVGGAGGAGDAFQTAEQPTPGATGTTGTEFNGIVGSGSGGAGGNWNGSGVGQAGGVGGLYGGGGGGGGGGTGGGGAGGLGGEGIIYIEYLGSSGTTYIVLDKDSPTTFTFPADWSFTNKILIVAPGGCGSRGSIIKGGAGGSGGSAIGVINARLYSAGESITIFMPTAEQVCAGLASQATFGQYGAGVGKNGDGTGGGPSNAFPGSAPVGQVAISYGPGLGGLGGSTTVSEVIPPEQQLSIPVLPNLYGYSAHKKPTFATIVPRPGTSGREVTRYQQKIPLWEFELTFEVLRDETQNQTLDSYFSGYKQYQEIAQLFLSIGGTFGRFFFDDITDNSRAGQVIGVGDGATTTFRMVRTWGTGALAYTEPVGAVNLSQVIKVYLDGVEYSQPGNWSIGNDLVTLTFLSGAPAPGVVITSDFYFYYKCRFIEDIVDFEQFLHNRWRIASLKFRSVNDEGLGVSDPVASYSATQGPS